MQNKTSFFNSIPPIVKNLIIINVLMLVATELFREFMITHFALYYPASPLFKPVQLFTHMFMHGGLMHLFFNMYALFIFGSVLERYWGPKRFLLYYLIVGLGAAGFYLLTIWLQVMHYESQINPETLQGMKELLIYGKGYVESTKAMTQWTNIMTTPMIGASGAIYGVLLAFGMMFPNVQLRLLFPPVDMKAKWFVIIFGAIELVLGLTQINGDNVAHFAHLGGMIFGFFLIKYWKKRGGNHPIY